MHQMKSTHARSYLSHRVRLALGVLLACLAGLLFASVPALAVFTRPYISSIPGAPTGPHGEEMSFSSLGGLAIENVNDGNIYIGAGGTIDEFNSSGMFVSPQITSIPSNSLAFDDKSGKLEGAGNEERVAVDNSTGPAAGDVYRAGGGSVRRYTDEGASAAFTCPGSPAYIRNGSELIGTPGEVSGSVEGWTVFGVAVDSGSAGSGVVPGDFYVLNGGDRGTVAEPLDVPVQIDQFNSEGCFVRAFTEAGSLLSPFEVGSLRGIAVDPVNGDVLVVAEGIAATGPVIDELTSSGNYLGQVTGPSPSAPFGDEAMNSGGIAVNAAGELYVNVCEQAEIGKCEKGKSVVDVFGEGADYPTVVTGEVSGDLRVSESESRATLNGVVRGSRNSEGKALDLTVCEFEFVTEEAFKMSVAEGQDGFSAVKPGDKAECVLESGLSPKGTRLEERNFSVHGELASLEPGQVYVYRLVATTNPAEHGGTQDGEAESFAEPGAPAVRAMSVGDISSAYTDFHAEIDPLGSATTYEFQYVDAAGYEAALAEHATDPYGGGASVPVAPASVGAGDRYVSVSVQAAGLSPGTAYHYRVVASNRAGVTDSVDGVFTTIPAGLQGLPDGRAYELVTPPNKGDAEDLFGRPGAGYGGAHEEGEEDVLPELNDDRGYSSEDGDHFLLLTRAAFGSFPASGEGAYVFSRNKAKEGWEYQSVVSPSLGIQNIDGLMFDPADFSTVGILDLVGSGLPAEHSFVDLDGPPGSALCQSPTSSDCYTTVASGASASPNEEINEVGASTDLSHVVTQSENHQFPLCESAQEDLAKELDTGSEGLYEWATGRNCLSLLDVNSEGDRLISRCGAVLGRGQSIAFPGDMRGAVSADGSKLFFTAPAPFDEENELRSVGSGCWNGGTVNPPELYMRSNAETTVEVSVPEGVKDPTCTVGDPICHPAIYVGASEDGSKVFFMTRAELTEEAVRLGTHEPELYEYDTEAPEGERLTRVSHGDLASGPVEGRVLDVPAISADGSAVYFNAEADLTPEAHGGGLYRYDTETGTTTYVGQGVGYPTPRSPLINGGSNPRTAWYEGEDKDKEIASLDMEAPYYTTHNGEFLLFGHDRYDAADNSIVCVMCNPNGSGPIPGASFVRSAFTSDNPAGGPPRPMSENGEYVFFDTSESLVPQDTNGVLDVYEWHDGTISLISSGEDPKESFFLDSSPDGKDVFFGTHAKLVPQDTDSSGDLYDARVCEPENGNPCIAPPASGTGPCEGDACDNPSPSPIDAPPVTIIPSGEGNLAPPPEVKTTTKKKTTNCKKRLTKKQNRCVGKPRVRKAKRVANKRRAGK
jgi:hypothetical protein